MAWNVFKFCTALRALGSIMIVFVLAVIGLTYYAVVIAHYGPSLFLGSFETFFAIVVLIVFHSLVYPFLHFLSCFMICLCLKLTLFFQLVMVMWCYSSVVVTDPGGVPPNWRPLTDEEKGDADPLVGSGYGSAQLDPKQSAMVASVYQVLHVLNRFICQPDLHLLNRFLCQPDITVFFLNLMQFYTFLETTLVSLLLLRVFMEFFNEGEIDETPGSLAATFITFVLNIAFTLSILGFLIMHITLVGANTSTIEAYEKKTSPKWRYDLGWKKNFEQVFGLDKKYWFIPAYSEDDLRRLPALHGFEYPTRPDLEPLQQH
ncbi:hypothetical protein Godav_016208 [Gossypium davidsonii]|uniref:Protein S-acyltransferase n=1 Tax=Gossypium davidsonii TaxID=34287 RepID=A0A7J8RR35_GOSDV|nr:hypothetical protein [Gossypium davidsonii]